MHFGTFPLPFGYGSSTVLGNSNPGEFSYVWQSEWVGIIVKKIERTRIHFLSDVLAAVAAPWIFRSLMSVHRTQFCGRLLYLVINVTIWKTQISFPWLLSTDKCVNNCDDPTVAVALSMSLPEVNRLVLSYLIRFLQVWVHVSVICEPACRTGVAVKRFSGEKDTEFWCLRRRYPDLLLQNLEDFISDYHHYFSTFLTF